MPQAQAPKLLSSQVATRPAQRIVSPIDESRLTTLAGNVVPLPQGADDLGSAAPATPVRRLQLLLARGADQDAALTQLLDRQQDSRSTLYRQWLTPKQFGASFGPSDADLAIVTAWLAGHGFTGIQPNAGRTLIEFSGTVAAVQNAFHTTLHTLDLGGELHYANVTDPAIPSALAPVVRGIASLNNLPRHAGAHLAGDFRRDNATGAVSTRRAAQAANPNLTINSNNTTYYTITPYDFAAIYDVLPLWSAGVTGSGQTIAVVGDTDINPADFVAFRTLFNLPLGSTNTSTGTQYLNIIYNGPNPGVKSDEAQGDMDTQWAAAVAKGAVIDYVVSESTETSLGTDLSAAYIVDNNLAGILSYSYSQCELSLGTAGNQFYKALWQQAAAQGITVLLSAGDSGSAACDTNLGPPATHGLAVNGMASTAYNVAVGGTDFNAPFGLSSYFNATNDANQASAKGYIPETTWNDSCTNASGPGCNTSAAVTAGLLKVSGGGGGASSCISSDGKTVASCTGGYAKPAWQAGTGVPADGVRDLPDVSLFSSQGQNGTFYVVCQQSRNTDGKACNLAAPYSDFAGYGGTSISTPAFAGMLAMVSQQTGLRLGNANYVLYNLAAQQTSTCATAGSCVFHDIASGTNAMPCVAGSTNCTGAGAYGSLSGYSAGVGYDQATGLGSVDAANLVHQWSSASFSSTSAVLTLTPQTAIHGAAIQATVDVTAASGTPTGDVSLNADSANGSLNSGSLTAGVYTASVRNLPGGTYGVDAHYSGDGTYAASDSNFVSVTISPESSTTTLAAIVYDGITGGTTTGVSTAPYGTVFYLRSGVAGLSGQGIATGNVLLNDNGITLDSGTYRLNSFGYTEAQLNSLAPGVHAFSASYTGDASFNPSSAPGISVTVTRAPTTLTVAATPATVSAGATFTLAATVATQSLGYLSPSGLLTFTTGGKTLGTSRLISGSDPTTFDDLATATLTIPASALALGANSITAGFPGDTNYLPSASNAATVTVTPTTLAATVTAATATPQTVQPGGTVTFAATVQPASTGTIQFIVDGQNVGAPVAMANSSAQLTESIAALSTLLSATGTPLTAGQHTLTAVYSGSQTEKSSVSAPFNFGIVTPGSSSLPVITVNPSHAVQGTFVTVQTQITPSSPVATGTARLVLDGGLYGSAFPLVNGAVALPLVTTTLQTGTHVISVYYSGDTTYSPSYAANATLVITAPGNTPSSVTLTGVPAAIQTGSSFIFQANIAPSTPTPTGILQLIVDGGNPGTPIALTGASNSVAFHTAGLALGTHTLAVFYSGDSTYGFSTSATATFNVVQAVAGADFTLTPAMQTLTANRLEATDPSVVLTATSNLLFNANITFSCAGLPSHTECAFAPTTATLGSSTALSTILTFELNDHFVAMSTPAPGLPWLPVSGGAVLSALLVAVVPRRRRLGTLLALIVTATALTSATGCGSGYRDFTTPAGTYNVTVQATGGGVTHSSTVTLIVQ
ncbi:Ig-like domain (group 3) [Granulicella rosea]|uniref:Ig-like domain (Group 3) n=1 Tax=Granulicella rosea TaxID=474952 RepID=A0A239H6Z0_9BACT|nr:Ig-like domain repeat protein [Granulicella rosea]SNS76915.1 Ig-like domain (group 3) [Granulicella rosea]